MKAIVQDRHGPMEAIDDVGEGHSRGKVAITMAPITVAS